MNAISQIDNRYDVCAMPDGSGFYVHDNQENRSSRVYASKQSAKRALSSGTIQWKDEP